MFPIHTILSRKESKGDALDTVRVLGASPVKRATLAEWEGVGGEHVVVAPHAEFGSNQVVPYEILQSQYDVDVYGDEPPTGIAAPDRDNPRARALHQLTPEQKLQAAAREQAAAKKPGKGTNA